MTSLIVDVVVGVLLLRRNLNGRKQLRNVFTRVQVGETGFVVSNGLDICDISWNRIVDNRVTARPVIAPMRSQQWCSSWSSFAILAPK